jgi:hypothetical protein
LATSADSIIYKLKSLYGAEGEEKARYPQGREEAISYHSFSLEQAAGKFQVVDGNGMWIGGGNRRAASGCSQLPILSMAC